MDRLPYLWLYLLCYAIGGIPVGLLIGKLNNIDIREHGSGNIGATNLLRVCGKRWGYVCFLADALKGFLPVLGTTLLRKIHHLPNNDYVLIVAVFGVICGHIWSPYLKFKGGKGVATSAGAILAIAPIPLIISLCIWYLTFRLSRYVSLASIVAAISLPTIALTLSSYSGFKPLQLGPPTMALLLFLSPLVIIKHRANIRRLLNGTENKFEKQTE